MAISTLPKYWSPIPKARLGIRRADERVKNQIVAELIQSSPFRPNWPYGMPTSVNPWLVLIGVSPGAAIGKGEDIAKKRAEYIPSIGRPHVNFDLKGEWMGSYWPKIRELCAGLMADSVSADAADALSLCGHLNLGEKQQGQGTEDALAGC